MITGIRNLFPPSTTIANGIKKASNLRNNADFFQKCASFLAGGLSLMIGRDPQLNATYGKLLNSLNSAKLHFALHALTLPNQFLNPVNSATIDVRATVDGLVKMGYNEFQKPALQKHLTAFLKEMESANVAYPTVAKFEKAYFTYLEKKKDLLYVGDGVKDFAVLNPVTLLDRITATTWVLTDFATVLSVFRDFKLTDTAKLAAKVGQVSGFKWVKNQQLDAVTLGLCTGSYALQGFEAVRKWFDGNTADINSEVQASQNRCVAWTAVHSATAAFFNGAAFLNTIGVTNIAGNTVTILGMAANLIGMIKISRPQSNQWYLQRVK